MLLPDGEHMLFTVMTSAEWDTGQIVVQSLATGERKLVVDGGYDARYLPSGHIVFAVGEALFGIAFDAQRLAAEGSRVPLVQDVIRTTQTPATQYGVAADGTLVYLLGESQGGRRTLVWVDRGGREQAIAVPPREYVYVNLSPDGARIALDIRDQENDIWIWELARERMDRLTFDSGFNRNPVWSRDGARLAFSREVDGGEEVYWQAWDGSGAPEQLTSDSLALRGVMPLDFSPDGTTLLYTNVQRPFRLFTAPVGAATTPGAPLSHEGENGAISPDGRWLAYQVLESGRYEIYVRPFPDVESGRWQVSTDGGMRPQWRDDGRELFFLRLDGPNVSLLSVAVEPGASFRAGNPQLLVQGPYRIPQGGRNNYDATADGARFLMIKDALDPDAAPTKIVIVQNWFEELRRLVPTE
jgi:serine/threonine-protein kinase